MAPAGDEPNRTMTPVITLGFHHFSLLVRDLDRAVAFYQNGMGLSPIPRPDAYSKVRWFRVGDAHELHLIASDAVPARHEGHPAFEVSDIRTSLAACLSAGGTLQQDAFTRPDGSLSAFVRDPDDNLVELTQHTGVV